MSITNTHRTRNPARTPDEPYNPLTGASIVEWFPYCDPIIGRKVTQAAGYSNGIACSDRTGRGKLYESNGFNIRDNLLQSITGRYRTFMIRITWKRSGRTIHYSIPVDDIQRYGEQQDRYDGLQWHLPLHHWSIDGAPPTGPEPEREPLPDQPMLFDFAEPRKVGAY